MKKNHLLAVTLSAVAQAAMAGEPAVDYMRDVKPILKERCFACHGALKQESSLRLDTVALMRQGGDGGAVMVEGDVAGSALVTRIEATDQELRMPPEGQPLQPDEIARIRSWIAAGAKAPANERPETDPRDHWSFARPARPALPRLTHDSPVRNPIDAFVQVELDSRRLAVRPAASKPILLRRVYLDLIGIPPTREELLAFLADDSPGAWTAVVDRLLSDPRYGERWARHWMDIWRYSDWYGRRHVPDVWNSAPQIWRWRDWIVRSLNEDQGYDRMVAEMLAADELAPEDAEAGHATGYLIRSWYALNPNDWMRANVEHTGKAFLGLTFNCAHCHDHKYDPISQEDYFRLRAFFEPISIRQDRVPGEADPGPFQEYEYSKLRKIQRLGAVRIFDKNPDAPTWFYAGGDERNRLAQRGSIAPGVPAFLTDSQPAIEPIALPPRAWYPGLHAGIQQTVLQEARAAVAEAESQLAALEPLSSAPSATGPPADSAPADSAPAGGSGQETLPTRIAEARVAAARAQLAGVEARIAADRARYETHDADATAAARAASRAERQAAREQAKAEVLACQWELHQAEARPADAKDRGKQIEAATTALAKARAHAEKTEQTLAGDATSEQYTPFSPTYPRTSTGRRRALAAWISSRENPLTARVAVNHIWMRHFHAPLVATVYDFGRNGARPSHPELLDWLAVELMESGWSMKHIHRLIVTSATWQRSSSVGEPSGSAAADPENHWLWRMNTGRMEAEVLRDSLLAVAERLDSKMGGQELENSEALTTRRRSLYYSVYPEDGGRSALGELFDAPNPLECYRRTRSVVPQQALALTNSELVHGLSDQLVRDGQRAARGPVHLESAGRELDVPFVHEMFERILSRAPTDAELQLCLDVIETQQKLVTMPEADRGTAARASLVRALFNHNDFITIR